MGVLDRDIIELATSAIPENLRQLVAVFLALHLTLFCLGSIAYHGMTHVRALYGLHDAIFPTSWAWLPVEPPHR